MLLRDRPMPATSQDPVLIRDRATVLTSALLLLVAAAAWVFVVLSSGHGEAMPMSISDGLVFTMCWAVMMTAMMLPSALPMIALYGAMQRRAVARVRRAC